MRDGHLIEEQDKFIQFPILIHQLLEASMFIVRRDEYVASKILIIEAIEQLQNILRIEHSHISGLLFNLIEIHPIDHDGLNRIYLPILFTLTFFYISERSTADSILCDIVLLFRTQG